MSIKINIKKNISIKLVKNYVFFTNEDFKINGLKDLNLGKDADLINCESFPKLSSFRPPILKSLSVKKT